MKDFIETPAMDVLRKRAQELSKRTYSDVIDAKGNQYVDLVQEGGGVLGIALAGYTYILEEAGIRFFSLAGTSAGAINTMMMAGLSPIGEPVSEKILHMLSEQNLFNLVDGHRRSKKLIQRFIDKKGSYFWPILFNSLRMYKTLKHQLGINPGDYFVQWISDELAKEGVNNLNDLNTKREQLPKGFSTRSMQGVGGLDPQIAVITSDITTHSKIEFPKMASLYWKEPGLSSPAKMVRASMSIPFFFTPFTVPNIPNAGKTNDADWDRFCKYKGQIPSTVRFVDGGMLSNFPINVFHLKPGSIPRLPTFGARLSTYRKHFSKTDTLGGVSGAMIQTMRQIYDYDFILKHPDYQYLICPIDANLEYNWLDFGMARQKQISLFQLGAEKGIKFLERFRWEDYKTLRKSIPS